MLLGAGMLTHAYREKYQDGDEMKAMILAAGLGTRLLPLTKDKPKPLFCLAGRPVMDILIRKLKDAGCESVIINTHHLAPMVDRFVNDQDYGIPVSTRFEPQILDTGGGIKNVEDFWGEAPFLVANGDIFTNIDFDEVYRFHNSHGQPVTMVLHDYEKFNNVWVDGKNHITGFGRTRPCPPPLPPYQHPSDSHAASSSEDRLLAFTGIQILDPMVLKFIPEETACSIIDVYCDMIRQGLTLKGFVSRGHFWHDIGTMSGYRGAVQEALTRHALEEAFPQATDHVLAWTKLKGDGSDRSWHRVNAENISVVVVDHGPPEGEAMCEADSFFAIGRHLACKGIPVPRLYGYDRPSGIVVMEDLGDLHLQTAVRQSTGPEGVFGHYKKVIDLLVTMGVEGAKGFDPAFTYQTPYYDRKLILEKEAKYFLTAFLNQYKGMKVTFEQLEVEFELLAHRSRPDAFLGFLHRDFQSRNILVKGREFFFIDFQGGRLGPLQYDLASLLIDPYVELPQTVQDNLLTYYVERLSEHRNVDRDAFLSAYPYCAINRNLQALGAFAFLSRVKGKKDFETYIPVAVASLKRNLGRLDSDVCRRLKKIVEGM